MGDKHSFTKRYTFRVLKRLAPMFGRSNAWHNGVLLFPLGEPVPMVFQSNACRNGIVKACSDGRAV